MSHVVVFSFFAYHTFVGDGCSILLAFVWVRVLVPVFVARMSFLDVPFAIALYFPAACLPPFHFGPCISLIHMSATAMGDFCSTCSSSCVSRAYFSVLPITAFHIEIFDPGLMFFLINILIRNFPQAAFSCFSLSFAHVPVLVSAFVFPGNWAVFAVSRRRVPGVVFISFCYFFACCVSICTFFHCMRKFLPFVTIP